jgi:hypothetical protein
MFVAGVAAIVYSYGVGNEGRHGDVVVSGKGQENGSPSGSMSGVVLEGPRSPVDGAPIPEGGPFQYFAVMIDNHTLARPEAGLADAPLVFEAPVEGGITRFMAVLADGANLRRIGPVRSVRPYYVEWALEYGAVLVHVGGSPEALTMLDGPGNDYRHLNQMVNGGYFWRDRERDAPHNVYTSSELLHSALDTVKAGDAAPDSTRPFKAGGVEGRPVGEPSASEITIDYSVASYSVTWVYDESTNAYARHRGQDDVTDESGAAITADNVIVQFTDVKTVDDVGRKRIRTGGTGDALVLRDGRIIEAQWSKEAGGRTRFLFTEGGEEIPLNVGKTWIQVVGTDTPVEY